MTPRDPKFERLVRNGYKYFFLNLKDGKIRYSIKYDRPSWGDKMLNVMRVSATDYDVLTKPLHKFYTIGEVDKLLDFSKIQTLYDLLSITKKIKQLLK